MLVGDRLQLGYCGAHCHHRNGQNFNEHGKSLFRTYPTQKIDPRNPGFVYFGGSDASLSVSNVSHTAVWWLVMSAICLVMSPLAKKGQKTETQMLPFGKQTVRY